MYLFKVYFNVSTQPGLKSLFEDCYLFDELLAFLDKTLRLESFIPTLKTLLVSEMETTSGGSNKLHNTESTKEFNE